MKKLLFSLLLFVIVLFFVGCEPISRGEDEYKLTVIDDFGYLVKPLKNYYKAGEEVEVKLVFTSGPSVGININGEYIGQDSAIKHDGANPIISFIMPNKDSILYTTMNGLILRDCGKEKHTWSEELYNNTDTFESYYRCISCGKRNEVEYNGVAKIVLKYEQEEQKRINELLITNPEYVFYFNSVKKVRYTYIFKDSDSVNRIIEKYDLSNLCSEAKISNFDYIKMLMITFERNQFTESIYTLLQEIIDKESSIEEFQISMERRFINSYVPNINYYIDEKAELAYEEEKNLFNYGNKSFIIKTKEEYEAYVNYLLKQTDFGYYHDIINSKRELYDELFFEENALIISKEVVRSSGSIKLSVDNVYKSDNKIYIVIRTDEPGMGTCDIQSATFSFIVKQSDVINVNEVITLD